MTNNLIKCLRPTYAYIDFDNLAHNISVAKSMSGSEIMAIVKAGGYGHGAAPIAEYAYKNCNVHDFGVATISEGFSLRESFDNDDPRIVVLGYADKAFYKDIIEHNLRLTVFDYEYADSFHHYLNTAGIDYSIVLKLDTGMGRLGFDFDLDLDKFKERYPRFKVTHVMSHLSCSDSDVEYCTFQQQRFDDFINKYSKHKFITSFFNSSAIARCQNKYTLTRPGLFLYGYVQGADIALKPVMSIRSKVVHVKQLLKGESVSYNRTFKAPRDMTIGVVPIGYADGYRCSLSNRGEMFIDNIKCNVVGKVCMDMTMIDLSEVIFKGIDVYNSDVEILGDNINAVNLSRQAGTMEYELLCGISDRIPRVYSE